MSNAQMNDHPTRDEVWRDRSAPSAFPVSFAMGANSAASFFSAAFFGRNDVIYLDEAGVPDILLCDLMGDRLEAMAAIYPAVQEVYAEDAFAVATRLAKQQRKFDLVITDPFSGLTWAVLTEHFAKFAALTTNYWVIGITGTDLTDSGIPLTLEGAQSFLNTTTRGRKFDAAWLEVRNSDNNSWWLGIRRRPGFRQRIISSLRSA